MKHRACFQAPCPYCVYRNEKVVDCHRGSGDVGTSTKYRLPLQRAEGQRISRRSLRLMKTDKTQSRRRELNAKLFSIIRSSSSSGRGTIIITIHPF